MTSFQTPLATLHKWNGWADMFLTTPVTGLTDRYGSLGYTAAKVGPLASLGANIVYHDYHADLGGAHYGHEWDALIAAKVQKYTLLFKYADYRAATFATNTRKFWVSIDWSY